MKTKLTAVTGGTRKLTQDQADHLWYEVAGLISAYRAPQADVSPIDQAQNVSEATDVARELGVDGVLMYAATVLRSALRKHASEHGLADKWNAHIQRLNERAQEMVKPDQLGELFAAFAGRSA